MRLGITFRIQCHNETTGPKRRCNRHLGPGIFTLPYMSPRPPPHPLTSTDGQWEDDDAQDEQWEGLETRLEPQVCFFFIYL